MANAEQNIKVINKNNSGFPDYLDFDKLRTEGIGYLGNLSGKIWTDHNVHDPGITILEVLCYALLDLGYRTNLPTIDIFTPDPAITGKDDNFFTPAQILACNPLTIIDYRKLLIDIDGVKNAWLYVATDQKDFCKSSTGKLQGALASTGSNCDEYLNGLYHVYIEPEKNIDKDFKDDASRKAYTDALIQKVRESLMAHRNLCEDFVDVYILCKLEMGVCANIELAEGADVEKTYISIAEKLRAFFSPSPQFYTLQQLLDKGKPIDDIFAGRPYDLKESHGFIDTDELVQIQLKKEIHLSDVYNEIFEVEGVLKINNLALKTCGGVTQKTDQGWKFKLPENYVPDFSMECSGFQLTRNGLPINFDTKKYQGLFSIDFSHNGKVLYKTALPYLDAEIPKGVYHSDLSDYFLLQNDFPRVYGVTEGGLPDNASAQRQAQALQLRGYLLFFDQLLAGYLSQLQHIRTLFARSTRGDKSKQHTYFLNQFESLPELNKLLRFAVSGNNFLGTEGSILVRTVSKKELDQLIILDQTKDVDPDLLNPFTFGSLTGMQVAIDQLKDDLYVGAYTYGFLNTDSSCIYYYISTSSDEYALLSKKSFKTIDEAELHLNSVAYIGTFDENYQTYIKDPINFAFDIELNMVSFTDYLQKILEDQEAYSTRRNTFLNHLLSRFAERFTDNALFAYYGNMSAQDITTANIKAKEDFLDNYDAISANRGKGYDYLENKWNNTNLSGFENEVKFLSGIENKLLHGLCNFVVEQYDDQYLVNLKIAGDSFFAPAEKFDSQEEAETAAQAVFNSLSNPAALSTQYIEHEKQYSVVLQYNDRNTATFTEKYNTVQEADTVRNNLNRMFATGPDKNDVFISGYLYNLQLFDDQKNKVRSAITSFQTGAEAQAVQQKLATKINDTKTWIKEAGAAINIGTLYLNKTSTDTLKFIDVKAFNIDINNTIVGKPDKFTYDLLDSTNTFKLYPSNEFASEKEARQHCYYVLTLATNDANFKIDKDPATGKFNLHIVYNGLVEASCYTAFDTEKDASKMQGQIILLVKKHEFTLVTVPIPNAWKFNFRLGYEPSSNYLFTSNQDYPSADEAMQAASALFKAIPSLKLNGAGSTLAPLKTSSKVPLVNLASDTKVADIKPIERALAQQQSIAQLAKSNTIQAFQPAVQLDAASNQGRYVYRLVDKDNVLAFYMDKYPAADQADLARRKVARQLKQNIKYLQICLGGDMINEVSVKTCNEKVYRYQIKARNYQDASGNQISKELVLFESVTAYASVDLAMQAFEKNYLYVIQLACDELNYGTVISLDETIVDNLNPTSSAQPLVFVPSATQKEIIALNSGTVPQAMANMAKTYPIKMVEYGSEAFNALFCEHVVTSQTDPCKTGVPRKLVYYFGTYNGPKDPQQWQSLKYYTTIDEAMQDFNFFVRLLRYPGNLYVDCDYCDNDLQRFYRIYLREVLAESANRFMDEETAWGKEGIEKFICAVQSGFGFHNYQKRDDCCYTFYLNCGPDIVVHPCVYDTAKRRNDVLNELYTGYNTFSKQRAYSFDMEKGGVVLLDENGAPFAKQLRGKQDGLNVCTSIMQIIDGIANKGTTYTEKDGYELLIDGAGNQVLRSYAQNYGADKWKATLKAYACYFPIVKTIDEKTGNESYCIELKYPGFSTCTENENNPDPCGCGDAVPEQEPTCYIAWKSSCCYATCDEAMRVFVYVQRLLSVFENYQPVFDCTCNSFGIALNFNDTLGVKTQHIEQSPTANRAMFNGGEIAFGPQCYHSAQMVCSAVERVKKLTNAEGLLVAEHILLRPHCADDCICRNNNYCGEEKRSCGYTWKVPHNDPCTNSKDICFIPGSDPYSFIATVVLPAWPQRFRSTEGRMFMEDLLYRTAPAHILLRIIWMAPHDFCCFESKYKNWRRWLAQKKTCIPDFSVCDFLDLLFKRNYACLEECTTCLPCKNQVALPDPCFKDDIALTQTNKYRFMNQVNETFCWQITDCNKYQFISCDQAVPGKPIHQIVANDAIAAAKAAINKPIAQAPTAKMSTQTPKVVAPSTPAAAPLVTLAPSASKVAPILTKDEKGVAQAKQKVTKKEELTAFISKRTDAYKTIVAHIAEKIKKNTIVLNVQQFLDLSKPGPEQLDAISTSIIQNKKPTGKGAVSLNQHQVLHLLQSVVCYTLDQFCVDNKKVKQIQLLNGSFDKMRKAKINVAAIYSHWDGLEVKKYAPDLNIDEIKMLLTGINKK